MFVYAVLYSKSSAPTYIAFSPVWFSIMVHAYNARETGFWDRIYSFIRKPEVMRPIVVLIIMILIVPILQFCRSQWPRGLRRGSAAARLLGLWVRIPMGAWMSVCCDRCVLSGRGLCVGLITRPEESQQLSFIWVWSWILANEEALAYWGPLCHGTKKNYNFNNLHNNAINTATCIF